MNRTHARRLLAVALALTAMVAFTPVAEANGGGKPQGKAKKKAKAKKRAHVTVMTRNLYLGTDLIPIVLAPSLAEFEAAASAGFAQVRATSFPRRARLIAREIRRTKPHLIGLQEVALWRTGPKDPNAAATNVAYDFLRILRRALRRIKQPYRVVRVTTEADVEGPTADGFDVRLTMRDVILVRRKTRGLRIIRRGGDNFDAAVSLETAAGTFTSTRGYAFADVRLRGKRFRFIDTHLEAFSNPVRTAQAEELVAPGGPASVRGRVILVGDLNSDPEGAPGPEPDAWRVLTGAGLRDTWPWLYPNRDGHACCIQDPGLTGPPTFTHRIDDVLAKGRLRPLNARIVGTHPRRSRTRSGLWASDHGGVATRIKLR